MTKLRTIIGLGFLVFAFAGCNTSKNDGDGGPNTTRVALVIRHTANGQDFGPRQKVGTANGDSVTIKIADGNYWAYYISNIKLSNSATPNTSYVEPSSYHLVELRAGQTYDTIFLNSPKEGTYNNVQLMLGIDTAQNTSFTRVGDANPTSHMAWDWNIGYKFIRIEGRYKTSGGTSGNLLFHTGGNPNQRRVGFVGVTPFQVQAGRTTYINLEARLESYFNTPFQLNLATEFNDMQVGQALSSKIATNYGVNLLRYTGANTP